MSIIDIFLKSSLKPSLKYFYFLPKCQLVGVFPGLANVPLKLIIFYVFLYIFIFTCFPWWRSNQYKLYNSSKLQEQHTCLLVRIKWNENFSDFPCRSSAVLMNVIFYQILRLTMKSSLNIESEKFYLLLAIVFSVDALRDIMN